jgi:hypothetical protein
MWTCEGGGGAGLASFKRAGLKLSVTPSVARNTMSSVVCVCVCVCGVVRMWDEQWMVMYGKRLKMSLAGEAMPSVCSVVRT